MVTVRAGLADGRGRTVPGGQEPPGHVSPADLRVLSPQECLSLLEPGGLGRVGFTSGEGIVILPVNFAVQGSAIIFRTAPDTLLAAHGNGPASFEADRVDEARREGWSVLVQGHAHVITSEREVQRLENGTRLEPWAGDARDVYVRITATRISGRRVGSDEPPLPGARR
jgi:nitroimidazol reductase NimA-like FMN-containing flavoprotein (pyridoxamine 5'-phosphate oxidase superfamily)